MPGGLFPYFRAAAQTTRSSGAFFNVEDRYFPEERIASACNFRLKSARHHAIAIPPAIPRAARKVCSPKCSAADKVELFQIAETFKARVIDYGKDSLLLEFVQTATKNDAVVKLIKEEFKYIEVVRGGSVGIESISMMER